MLNTLSEFISFACSIFSVLETTVMFTMIALLWRLHSTWAATAYRKLWVDMVISVIIELMVLLILGDEILDVRPVNA